MSTILAYLIKIRDHFLMCLVNYSKPIYGHFFKQNLAWKRNQSDLKQLPTGTLGYELACFLEAHQFMLLEKFEDHDVMHVLFHFKTTVLGEARMQFFLLGNGKKSLYVWASIIIATLSMPEHWSRFKEAYQDGKSCICFYKWDFQFLLKEEISCIRTMIRGEKAKMRPIFF